MSPVNRKIFIISIKSLSMYIFECVCVRVSHRSAHSRLTLWQLATGFALWENFDINIAEIIQRNTFTRSPHYLHDPGRNTPPPLWMICRLMAGQNGAFHCQSGVVLNPVQMHAGIFCNTHHPHRPMDGGTWRCVCVCGCLCVCVCMFSVVKEEYRWTFKLMVDA